MLDQQKHILNALNPEQQAAVSSTDQALLVLAGAGSGKTRVLVHRMAWLISQGASPQSMLTVTFTNRAAREMKDRIDALCQLSTYHLWVGTFHGLAHRLLRQHWQDAKLPQHFQILDQDDQQRIIKRLQKELGIDDQQWPPKKTQWFINKNKEKGTRASSINPQQDYNTRVLLEVYRAYETYCDKQGCVDFAELLLRSFELLQRHDALREHYQRKFQHILVDEFQDTNTLQYQWIKILTTPETHIMAVGDDDQSIYGWRGADIENLQRFSQDFPHTNTIRLEQNYRSTAHILKAANGVIKNNVDRLGKNLWTQDSTGELITVFQAFNEQEEAHYVVNQIKKRVQEPHFAYNNIAVLYRSNAQSRVLEEHLIRSQLPYRIYGGHRFFERQEIKDALAYFRLVVNRHDDAAFERVINVPTRGIGMATLDKIREAVRASGESYWQVAERLSQDDAITARTRMALLRFLQLINDIDEASKNLSLDAQAQSVYDKTGLMAHYKKNKNDIARVENLEELINAMMQFHLDEEEQQEFPSPLSAFLAHVALESQFDENEQGPSIHLMTVHSAKGLEFPIVFITGMEEGLFPHQMSLDTDNGIEEERRLCYVGTTRAMKKLYFVHAETRQLFGRERWNKPSRFLKELPDDVLEIVRPEFSCRQTTSSTYPPRKSISAYRQNKSAAPQKPAAGVPNLGQRVCHKKFGTGTITNASGDESNLQIQVQFDKAGSKWLLASVAKLEKL